MKSYLITGSFYHKCYCEHNFNCTVTVFGLSNMWFQR